MTDYLFDTQPVFDPNNTQNVVTNSVISIYPPDDEDGSGPLADLKDPFGFPLANPLNSNYLGFIPALIGQYPQLKWKSGNYSGFLYSYQGLRDEAVAASDAAEESQDAAEGALAAAEATANGFTVGTVTSGSPASASFTGTAPNRQLNLVIPPGEPGADGAAGADGEDGHNPITVSDTAPASPAEGDIWFDTSGV